MAWGNSYKSGLLAILAAGALAGCSRADGGIDPAATQATASPASTRKVVVAEVAPTAVPPPREHRESRTIERDPDGDGIANYRCIITDTYDASGRLISRTRAEDLDADGIVDARTTTTFD